MNTPKSHPVARLPLAMLSLLAAFDATAQEAAAPPETQAVVVTGTRARNRTASDSESPVDILSAKDLSSTGTTELATALARLLPSFNFPRPSGGDASDAVRPAQLRGLSPDQTLVLIDGKRRHTSAVVNVNGTEGRGSAPVDLNAIPISAIDHIEVLRDGAAAQYGSDAIAGVINIILKKGPKGGEVEIGGGEYQEHDGREADVKAQGGFALGANGWLRLAADVGNQDPTNRAGPDFRTPSEPLYGQVTQRYGDPGSQAKNFLFNSQYSLSDEIDFYAFGNLSERNTSDAATWRPAYKNGSLQSSLYPDGFLPIEDSASVDRALVVGVRSNPASGWRWDASLNYGSNTFDMNVDNTANFALGAASPTHFYAGQLTNEQTLLNFDLAREYAVSWLASPLTVALGAEARHERYRIGAGDPESYYLSGSQGFGGFNPNNSGSWSRNSKALYANFEGSLAKNWSASLAVRTEDYSDFGTATSEKLSTRFAFNDALALRATASTGFRAPSLAQENYTITATNFFVQNGVNTPIQTGTFGVNTEAARALGAQPLKAEKSNNLTLGLQFDPSKSFTAAVDLYRIDIDNRVLYSANLPLSANLQAELAAQGEYVGAARYFTNALDTRTLGIDAVSTYRLDLQASGKLDFTLAYNHNNNEVRGVASNPAILAQNGLTLIDRQTIGRATVGSPKDKLVFSTDYKWHDFSAHAAATRYGSFTVEQNNAALDQTYGASTTLDLSASERFGQWSVTGGIDNATNRYPDRTTTAGNLNTNGIYPYSVWSPYGFNGRFYYAKASYRW
jgi:iron complex outermembrane receptor protein